MKKLLIAVWSIILLNTALGQKPNSGKEKINQLINQMTLDEKIGQMTQVTLAVVAKAGWGN